MFKKILLAHDGSEGAIKALETGTSLAKLSQAELWALAVQEVLLLTHVDTEIAETAFSQQHFEQI
jgi:nucleotide-binding universal stress UspA family protein